MQRAVFTLIVLNFVARKACLTPILTKAIYQTTMKNHIFYNIESCNKERKMFSCCVLEILLRLSRFDNWFGKRILTLVSKPSSFPTTARIALWFG